MKAIFSNMAPSSLVLILTTLFFISSTFFLPIHAASLSDHLQGKDIPGVINEIEYGVVSYGVSKRSILEGSNGENSSMILAAERTHRKDPLDDFKYYTGGWNISDEHYIASVAYSAAPLLLVAAIWLVGFGLCLLLSCLCFCCCRGRHYGYSRTAYACSIIFLVLFTVAAIFGAVVLYTGQGKFHNSTTDTLDYVVNQAESTVNNLRNVSAYLAAAKRAEVNQIFLPQDVQNNIDRVDSKIDSAATTLETETKNNKDDIQHVLKIVRLVLIIVSAVMLFVALLGFLFSIFGLQGLVYILVILGWILVAGTFILSGVFLVLHNATGDTCVSMDQWVKNPTAHTALDDILPCVETETAEESLSQSKDVVLQLVGVVNRVITNVSNVNLPRGVRPFGYNQSGPLVPVLCSPFNPDRTDRKCIAGEVDLSNATQVWTNYVCQVSQSGVCITVGRLTPSMYNEMAAVVNVSYALYHYGPFLKDLVDCDFVRDTFTGIYNDHCPDLKQYSRWVYFGLVLVSAAVALSLILWILYARERRHRKYTKLVGAASYQSFEGKRP